MLANNRRPMLNINRWLPRERETQMGDHAT